MNGNNISACLSTGKFVSPFKFISSCKSYGRMCMQGLVRYGVKAEM